MPRLKDRLEHAERAAPERVELHLHAGVAFDRLHEQVVPFGRGARHPLRIVETLADHAVMNLGLLPQIGLASLAMAAFLWWISGDWAAWTEWSALRRSAWLGLAVAGGVAVYFGVLGLAGARPRDLKHL